MKNQKKIAVGLSSIERGNIVEAEVVMARLSDKLGKVREFDTSQTSFKA